MNPYEIIAKIAKAQFITRVLKYRLSSYEIDVTLDCGEHLISILAKEPGVLWFQLERTKEVLSHFEVYLRSRKKMTLISTFHLNENFPSSTTELTLVNNNE